jgi:hypothetical protein
MLLIAAAAALLCSVIIAAVPCDLQSFVNGPNDSAMLLNVWLLLLLSCFAVLTSLLLHASCSKRRWAGIALKSVTPLLLLFSCSAVLCS